MLFKFSLVAALLALTSSVVAAPFNEKRADGPGHPYTCDRKFNAAHRKQHLLSIGANALDLAITIEETCAMSGTSYPLGDVQPNGKPKTGDSANFGLFKNNWFQMRKHCSQFKGLQEKDWRKGEILNTHDASAIKCQHEQIKALGQAAFYEAQRGVRGQGPDYGNAIKFVHDYLNQGHLRDDKVTFYNLHNV